MKTVALVLVFAALVAAHRNRGGFKNDRNNRNGHNGHNGHNGGDRPPWNHKPPGHSTKPNVIMLFADDLGFGDLFSYGHPTQERGPIDELADNGLRFINAYSSDSVCSPSRVGMLTGRLPVRVGAWGEKSRVFLDNAVNGLPRSEFNMAEAFKAGGYTTGMVGKWHLGINKETSSDGYHLPHNQGFDFVGHMVPFGGSLACDLNGRYEGAPVVSKCSLYYGDKIIAQPYQQENLTLSFINDITKFIKDNQDGPFFMYYAMMHPHVPMFSSAQFHGKSKRGPFGDNINEMAWSAGEIVSLLKELKIDTNTLIVFTSDHGPHLEYCLEGGNKGIFRGSKGNSYEGGFRVPLITYWPGHIAPGISREIISALDFLPSFASLAGSRLPKDRVYDGSDSSGVLLGTTKSTRNSIFFYNRDSLMAVRYGKYKLHYLTLIDPTPAEMSKKCLQPEGYVNKHYFACDGWRSSSDCVTAHDPPLIYDLEFDPIESFPLDPADYVKLLRDAGELIKDHNAHLDRPPPLMDEMNDSVTPCCGDSCHCNFP
ncbi:sulfatase-like hydrolase/transferase [Salmonella sp. s55004]|uniref:sulfatase-like hydrolase/transferase n=3 Tax=unclassified Salmonella TaxID=2614656 RepID=UPI0039802A99